MGIVFRLIKKWYILMIVVMLFFARAFFPSITPLLPLSILVIWLLIAIIAQLIDRNVLLKMKPDDELLNDMFADNDRGYKNIIDAVQKAIDKNNE